MAFTQCAHLGNTITARHLRVGNDGEGFDLD